MTYLNHAGTSWPKPEPVQRAARAALGADPGDWGDDFERARRRVAAAFGIEDADRLLLTPGCTSALQVAVTDHPWQPGDRLLHSALEHHALTRPAEALRARGVEVAAVPSNGAEPFDLVALERELRGGRVRLVGVTAACNVTGDLLPVEEIVALAHEHGALCLVDGAQVAGWMPIDVAALGVDLFTFAGHKALQAPWGIGGLYVASHVAMTSPAAACELPADSAAPECASMPGYCDVGSVDRVALAGLVAGLDWLDAPEQAGRLATARGWIERLASTLEELPGVRLHGGRAPERRLPTVAFTVDGRPSHEIAAELSAGGIVVGSGLQCAPLAHETLGTAPTGVIRLSAGPSSGAVDVERTLEALATVCGAAQ